uniref:Retrovirus-related Pol polyprotein from transposon 17.6 n=1 Tax=Anoplophora glabripennis TaxID=217634 RepID=V5I885_ANOGL
MGDPVVMSEEQFQRLLATLTVRKDSPPSQTTLSQSGNFTQCSSRFKGDEHSDVNAFIDAIKIYKDCTHISDVNALRGLPMLLDDFAATWFQGVKGTIQTWSEAVTLLKTTFGQQKAPYRVYRELFAHEQDLKTSTDVFICRARSLLANIPQGDLSEKVQIDMVYGLLHKRIREKVPRDKVTTFNELLTESRLIEELFDKTFDKIMDSSDKDSSKRPRCAYCKNLGHTKDQCRKLLAKDSGNVSQTSIKPVTDKTTVQSTQNTGNTMQQQSAPTPSTSLTQSFSCYGYGRQGYVRATCPTCRTVESNALDFCEVMIDDLISPRPRPYLYISVLGSNGTAILDTAAKQSFAGSSLYSILKQKGQSFKQENVFIKLADESGKWNNILVTRVDVLQGHTIPTNFIILPDAENTSTLLGIDFIEDEKIVLDISNKIWHFTDTADIKNKLPFEVLPNCQKIEISSFDNLRSDEGTMLTDEQRNRLNALLEENQDIFEMGGEPTPYAEHYINTGDHPPISTPPYRMTTAKKEVLKRELDKLLEEGIIEECESPWAAPVVLVPKKDGGTRLCIDYRRLNSVTVSDSYPLPRIDDLLHATKRTFYMTTIDFRSGYHQIKVNEQSRDKIAFVTPFGTYRYLRLPFGLKNAPGTLQ